MYMEVFEKIVDLQDHLQNFKDKGAVIGFVPTMGALHDGHLSLVRKARQECDVVVASIFVNPVQFNNKIDLQKYPRSMDEDLKKLTAEECDVAFVPQEAEMLNRTNTDTSKYNFGYIEEVMEGAFRPGHFKGVAYIVEKLFGIVKPDKAFFGEKDYQQLTIIKELVKQTKMPVEIISCPTIRESDGLAMSSRNVLLSSTERQTAKLISQTLFEAKQKVNEMEVASLRTWAINKFQQNPEINLQYFDIVNGDDLQPVNSWNDNNKVVGCIAATVGTTHLIDNLLLNS